MKFGKKEKETQEEEVVRGEIQRVVPDYRVGLNPEQIRIREENGWTNDEVAPPGLTTKEIVHNNIFTYFNLIFLILAILLCLVGSFRNLTFLPVIICNTLIGIIQEIRSKKVLDRLTMLNAPHAEVIRGGVSLNPDEDGEQVVEAEVPMSEMQDFTTFLRQLTQGRGWFTFDFVRYETLPQMLEAKVIEQAKALGNFAEEEA